MKNFSHDVEKMFSDSWNGGIITSPDWDGIVSAAIICAHFEKTHLIGFYVPNDDNDTSRVYLSDQINDDNILDELENAVWVDLDIWFCPGLVPSNVRQLLHSQPAASIYR